MLRDKVKSFVVSTGYHQGNIGLLQERRRSMNETLKRTLKVLLYAGAALMVVVAGSANWPNH
jgi:hypothetical protein